MRLLIYRNHSICFILLKFNNISFNINSTYIYFFKFSYLSEFQIILNLSLEDTQKKLDKALKRNLEGQKKSAPEDVKRPTNELPVDEPEEETAVEPPPGVKAMMISMKNMDKYGLKTGPGIKVRSMLVLAVQFLQELHLELI